MTIDKDRIRDEFSPLLDGELAPDERAELEQNLAEDAGLLWELDGLRKVDELYRQLPSEQAPEGFEDGVRGALQPGIVRFTRRRLGRKALWPVAAAAAMFVVFAGVLVTQFDGPFQQPMQMASAPDAAEPELAEKTVAQDLGRRSHDRGRQEEPPPAPPARAPAPAPPQESAAYYDHDANGIAASGIAEESAPRAASDEGDVLAAAKPSEEVAELGYFLAERAEADSDDEAGLPSDSPQDALNRPSTLDEESPARVGGGRLASDIGAKEEESVRAKGVASIEDVEVLDLAATEPAKPDAETEKQRVALLGFELADAVDPEAKGTTEIRKVGDREFRLRTLSTLARASGGKEDKDVFLGEKIWVQEGYKDEKPRKLERGSEALARLLAKHKELEKLLELDGSVVFRIDKQWYQLAPKPKATDEKEDGQP